MNSLNAIKTGICSNNNYSGIAYHDNFISKRNNELLIML